MDFYTNGMVFYNLKTGKTTPHPNSAKLHHLYNPNFSPNGKWIVATVHAGMGFGHTILLIEAHGDRIIDLKIPGCRPRLSPDNKHIAWGSGDHELDLAPIDLDAETPSVGPWSLHITDEKNKIYHIDWSPDGRYVAFSRGPEGEGDLTKKGSFRRGLRDRRGLCGRLEHLRRLRRIAPARSTCRRRLKRTSPS